MRLEISAAERTNQDTSHDRLCVLRDAHRTLIALADGVDSREAAQKAAARTVSELARCFRSGALPSDPRGWVMLLEGIDHAVLSDPEAGETSALVMLVEQGVVLGASVGDSLAYVVGPVGETQLLSGGKQNWPRIGTGIASPRGFGPVQLDGKLITRRAGRRDPGELPAAIAAGQRLDPGASLERW